MDRISLLEKVEKSLTYNTKIFKKLVTSRELLQEVYDDNFLRIEQCEKKSKEHMKLLIIENALNAQSAHGILREVEAEQRIQAIKKKIDNIHKHMEKIAHYKCENTPEQPSTSA